MSEGRRHYDVGVVIPGTVYRVKKVLGGGGMGSVYDVEDTTVGKRYVLKTLHSELGNRADLARRIELEARSLARLAHPNIVDVVTAGMTTDELRLPYYVMERLNGQNLRFVLSKRGSLELPHALHIGIDLLDALESAHDIQIFHRDVKPDNIFLHRGINNVTVTKLLDFGIARDSFAPSMTGDKFVGTLRYAAPEQLKSNTISARSDLYAAGLVLFEMLAGRGPFDDASNVGAIAQAHMTRIPPTLAELGLDVPPELDKLLRSALAKDPAQRPKDAFTFASHLRNLKCKAERPSFTNDSRPTAVSLIQAIEPSKPPSTPPLSPPLSPPEALAAAHAMPGTPLPATPTRLDAKVSVPLPDSVTVPAVPQVAYAPTLQAATRASTPDAIGPSLAVPTPPQVVTPGGPFAPPPLGAAQPPSMPQPYMQASPGMAPSAMPPASLHDSYTPTNVMAPDVDRGATTQTSERRLPTADLPPAWRSDGGGGESATVRDTVRQTVPMGSRSDLTDAAMQVRAAMSRVPVPTPVEGRTDASSVRNVAAGSSSSPHVRAVFIGAMAAATLAAALVATVVLFIRARAPHAEGTTPAESPVAAPTLGTPLFDEIPSATAAAVAPPAVAADPAAPAPSPSSAVASTRPPPLTMSGSPVAPAARAPRAAVPPTASSQVRVVLPPELDERLTMPAAPTAAPTVSAKRLSGL